jgi:hypothetical protein
MNGPVIWKAASGILGLATGLVVLLAIAGGCAGAYETLASDVPYRGSTMIGPAIALGGGLIAMVVWIFSVPAFRRERRSFPVWIVVTWVLVLVPATMGSHLLWGTEPLLLHPVWLLACLLAATATAALYLTYPVIIRQKGSG